MPLPRLTSLPLRGRRVAVFGATGFIGSRLVEKLVGEHHATVTAAVRNRIRRAQLASMGARLQITDLRKPASVEQAVSGCDIVFNLAYNFRGTAKENVEDFANLTNACRSGGVRLLVHSSSIAVYDDWPSSALTERSPREKPGSEYKNAKMAMDEKLAVLAAQGSLRSVVLQPTIVYGPRGRLWTDLIAERLLTGAVVLPDCGQGLCNAVYVDDVADAMILGAMVPDAASETFIISGAHPVTWRTYFEAIAKPLGLDAIKYADSEQLRDIGKAPSSRLHTLAGAPWVRAGLNRVLEIIGPASIERIKSLMLETRRKWGDSVYYPAPHELELFTAGAHHRISKARERLGYEPAFDFATGSRLTAEYLTRKYLTPAART